MFVFIHFLLSPVSLLVEEFLFVTKFTTLRCSIVNDIFTSLLPPGHLLAYVLVSKFTDAL